MNLHFYTCEVDNDWEQRLLELPLRHPGLHIARHSTLEALVAEMARKTEALILAVLENEEEIEKLTQFKELFEDVKLILVLKTRTPRLLQKAILLRPRVIYPDWVGFTDVAYSIGKMIQH